MKLCVSELEGRALNYAVAFALWGEPKEHHLIYTWGESRILDAAKCVLKSDGLVDPLEFSPSENWVHAGPIIQEYGISIFHSTAPDVGGKMWSARTVSASMMSRSQTPTSAAMKEFVYSRVGGEIEIPDELCEVKLCK